MRKLVNVASEQGDIYWYRVTSFVAGATLAIDGQAIAVDGLLADVSPVDRPWKKIETTGTINVDFGDSPRGPYPGPTNSGGNAPATDGARASGATSVSDVGGVGNPALFDQTSAVNTALDPGILDVTPWRELLIEWVCSAGTSAVTVKDVDDVGTDWTGPALAAPAAAISGAIAVGPGTNTAGGITLGVGTGLPRRVHVQAGSAGVGNTVRLRIQGRR